jgi:hypothetical protein
MVCGDIGESQSLDQMMNEEYMISNERIIGNRYRISAVIVAIGVLFYFGCVQEVSQSDEVESTPDYTIDAAVPEGDASVNTPDYTIDAAVPEGDASVNTPDYTIDAAMDVAVPEQDGSVSTGHCDGLAEAFTQQMDPEGEPPFVGTLFVHAGLIIESDPTAFTDLSYAGVESRTMFDRRTAAFGEYDAHLFNIRFGSSKIVEFQVNTEFTRTAAEDEARRYAYTIGQLPGFLFRDLQTVWIHKGNELFGGGNQNLLIHVGQGAQYIADGLLGEVFLHEASHTSMDAYHLFDSLWQAAQNSDVHSISNYARDFPEREDVAETVPMYLAARFWADRIPESAYQTIVRTIPNRMLYLDCQGLSVDILQ